MIAKFFLQSNMRADALPFINQAIYVNNLQVSEEVRVIILYLDSIYRKRLFISACFSHVYNLYTSEVYACEHHSLISNRLRYLNII